MLNRKHLRMRYGNRWGNMEKTVNCIYLCPPCTKIPRPHCNFGGGARGDCFIYLGKSSSCKFHKPIYKQLTYNEVLAKVTERHRQASLVKKGFCPECTTELKFRKDGDKVCPKCNLSWVYVEEE